MLISKSRYLFRIFTCNSVQPKIWIDVVRKINYSAYQLNKEKLTEDHSEAEESNDEICNQNFTKLDFNDPTLSNIMLQVKSKKMREKSNMIFFEGRRVLKEALDAGIVPLMVFFTRKDDIKNFSFPKQTKLLKIPYNELKVWSSLATSPGILAICRKPDIVQNNNADIPVTIICDNIREPGNLGALIRNAVGAGVKDIILSKGCVDLWDPKVIRAGTGTHFRKPIHSDIDWSEMKNYLEDGTLLLMATNKLYFNENKNNKCVVPYCKVNYFNYSNITVIIGGETEGISENAYNLMKLYENIMVTIPLSNQVESLNSVSALSIILFEIKRQILFFKE